MLDTLIIHIPIRREFVVTVGNLNSVIGDASYYGIETKSYYRRDLQTNEVTHGVLKHEYESLPSSYSGMGLKFFSENVANTLPYVSMTASAKILQGHNVYGGESVKNLSAEMLSLLQNVYPDFFACLDLAQASISRIDSTYSVRLEREEHIQPCIRFLANISNGQRKNDTDRRDFFNTVYWGGATSREGGAKAYGKHCEVMKEVAKLNRDMMRGCLLAKNKLSVFTPELLDWSAKLLRFESSTKKRKLEKLGLPTNLWQFIEYQQKNKRVLTVLWQMWFNPILKAIEGDLDMENYEDAAMHELCRKKLVTFNKEINPSCIKPCYSGITSFKGITFIKTRRKLSAIKLYYSGVALFRQMTFTKTGKASYTKANNAFNFYQLLKANGYEAIKKRYGKSQFINLVNGLTKLGIPKAHLQYAHDNLSKSVPMVDLIKFDFNNQYPADYQPIISEHINAYDYIISKKPKLRLVA